MFPSLRVSVCYGVLMAAVVAATLTIAGPSVYLGDEHEEEEDGGPRPDGPAEYLEWRRLSLIDENGVVPIDGLARAKEHVDAMREIAPLAPIAGITRGTWTTIGPGNVGGRVRALSIDPRDANTILLGGVAGGLWRTIDGGASWAPVDDFMANLAVSTIARTPGAPDVLYAGTGEGYWSGDAVRGAGIFKSVDNGASWVQLAATSTAPAAGQSATDYLYVNRLAMSADGATLLAATRSGLFRSTTAGATFSRATMVGGGAINAGLYGLTDVDFHPTDPLRAVAAIFAGSAAYSVDGGATWSGSAGLPGSATGFNRVETAFAPSNGAIVYASIDLDGGSMYRSTNAGQTFVEVYDGAVDILNPLSGQGWYDNLLAVSPTDENFVIWGGVDLYRSINGAAAFTKFSAWQSQSITGATSAHADHHYAVPHPGFNGTSNKTFFFANDGGIYRADDVTTAGNNPPTMTAGWVELNNGFAVTQFYGGAGHPGSGRITGGTQDNGTLLYNPAAASPAENWTRPFGGDGGFSAYDATDANFFYGEYVYLQIHRNTSGGTAPSSYIHNVGAPLTDANNPNETEFIAAFTLDPNNPNRLLGAAQRLWRSNNVKGATPSWEIVKNSLGLNDKITAIAVAPGNSDIVYIGHNSGRVYKTIVGNAAAATLLTSWTTIDDNGATNRLPPRRITRLTVDPSNNNTVYATLGGFAGDNVYRSADGGASWADITGPTGGATALPDVPVRDLEVHPTNSGWLYAGTEVGIFTSENGGASWSLPHDGPSNAPVDELFFMGTNLVAVTHGRGMFVTPTALVSAVQPPTNLYASEISGNTVTLRWTPPAAGLAPTQYVLTGGVNPGEVLATIPTGGPTPAYTFVAPTGAFYVRMQTVSGSATSAASNEIRIFVNVAQAPSPPARLLGMVSGSVLSLSWLNTFAGGAPSGVVLDVTGSLVTSIPLGLADSFTYPTVPPGTYNLSLRATNAAGVSGSSNVVTLTFPGACSGVPQVPANFLATRAGNVITVTWESPFGGPAPSAYVLNVGGSFVGSFPTTGRSLSGTVGAGSYSLSVYAANACGTGPATAPLIVTVP